ncbi:putative immunoglobulin-blocking virulence protein [Mycoplasmopsis phocirhinis]|uniref:Putative immunoglobulin-blocking virulence protein n=1 Tax=Mycoplasmopsis phocirhinis TaxID=142650 RepID=A0A4P6MPN8_9BACT|nr:putative immunoglobulin-blocking virulence protein [Mycoplasmopsis phocirhinis]QBF34706.1 putative immunoglobulin-blocking virulence protein [Mycoplasmopsis phocirhinis]
MNFLKNKKIRNLTLSLFSTVSLATIVTTSLYYTNSKPNEGVDYQTNASADTKFIAKDNLDLQKTINSLTDENIRELPKPIEKPKPKPKPEESKKVEIIKVEPIEKPKPKPEPIPQPKPIEEPKPIEKPKPIVIPKTEPKPEIIPTPIPQPKPQIIDTTTQINPFASDDSKALINILGVNVRAEVTRQKPREINHFDIQNKISNIEPYQSNFIDKIVRLEVTEQLIDKVVENVAGDGTKNTGINAKYIRESALKILREVKPEDIAANIATQVTGFWQRQFEKWSKLFDSENVINFLVPDAAQKYKTMQFHSRDHRYIWLYNNLDFTKFKRLSANALKNLSEGLIISEDNVFINENGELDSYSAGYPEGYNNEIARRTRDNYERRVFSFSSAEIRTPYNVQHGIYPGWKSQDVTDEEQFKSLNVSKTDGINIIKMTREKPVNDKGQINEGYVLEIDAANPSGYAKTKQLLIDLKAKPEYNFVSFRIRNMGHNDASQKFKEILEQLPDQIPQLELFFSDRATNTSSLIALENKTIKELSLYTLGNSLLDNWSINPFALRNTKWINTNDYNVSFEYKRGEDIATRITFNTLAFDSSDYQENDSDPFKRINLGLRMAYYARNNEPIFQGGFGAGLNPDHNEGDNSYPVGLDFSRVAKIKSLRGLKFHDEFKPSNKARKISRLVLFNDSASFSVKAQDLNEAGLEHIVDEPMQPSKIIFSNGSITKRIRIETDEQLSGSGLVNLTLFIKYAKNASDFSNEIEINPGASSLKTQLEQAGFKVVEAQNFTFA